MPWVTKAVAGHQVARRTGAMQRRRRSQLSSPARPQAKDTVGSRRLGPPAHDPVGSQVSGPSLPRLARGQLLNAAWPGYIPAGLGRLYASTDSGLVTVDGHRRVLGSQAGPRARRLGVQGSCLIAVQRTAHPSPSPQASSESAGTGS